LDCIQTAHDRWRQLTGYDAPSVWVDYPVDLSIVSAQFVITALDVGPTDHYISIDRDNDPWSPALIYHEYGHSLHFHSYTCQNLGLDSNAYAAYNGVTGYSFQKNGTSFGEQDNNAQWESEGGAWAALKEGFADFFAAVNMGWDRGAIANTLERNVDHPAVNDDKAAHSISRALWDVYDTDLTSLCCWGSGDDWTAWTAIVRPVGPLGSGDDDRIRATSNLQMLSRVWTVMDEDWPASISELRSRVRSRYAAESGNLRLLDTVLRANGLCAGDIANTRPSIGNARVTSDNAAGPPHRGVVRVYCEVTDPDVAGGQRDSDHVKVRLDYGVTSAYPPYGTTWYPVGFTLAKASAPPPGESGEYWYVIDWDTTTQSPCESMYDDGLYGYFWNEQRETTQILGRRENVKLRLIATDDMQDSAAVEVPPFTVNNPVGDQGFYGFISKPWGDGFQGIAGATVQLRQGADSPTGQLVDTTASNEFGVYSFEGVPAGAYTVVASKSGFTTNWRNTTVVEGEYKGWQDLVLTPVGPASMRSVRGGCIRWTAGVSSPTGTYEFWYRPVGTLYGTEWGSQVAQVSRDYPDWMGDGLHRFSSMEISYREVPVGAPGGYASVFVFGIADNADSGDPNEPGTYHQLSGTTPIELEHWYHVAAVYGSYGMKLFVNGHLEASNDYTGAPQAFDGVAAGGWFCLGDNYLAGRPQTASGDYRGLRVSSVQRYSADFSPVDVPASDASTDILDALAGTTNGENHGFVPTPVTP
jgi:hypothetical protein